MAERDPAEARLWALTGLRLLGFLVVVGGLGLAGTAGGKGVWAVAGLALMAAGAALLLLGPRALARKWRQ